MINHLIAIILCMIGIFVTISGVSPLFGILLTIFGFGSGYSLVKKEEFT